MKDLSVKKVEELLKRRKKYGNDGEFSGSVFGELILEEMVE